MRGEDGLREPDHPHVDGSPPHARGRRRFDVHHGVVDRITPACAGKTEKSVLELKSKKDHPRMRGEDQKLVREVRKAGGSPPHARGRLDRLHSRRGEPGITPACAGKTSGRLCTLH